MPKREDIHKILIIGSGPIIIGQACEFDYSGTQACKALRSLGYEIVLVNSNPATIMTDASTADATYIEPLNEERLAEIIEKERPDAVLPNLGGQSGLNLCLELEKSGILKKFGVEVIGVQTDAIERGEDRIAFKETMDKLGIEMARSMPAYTIEEAEQFAKELGYPVVIRPAFTMGGTGGGIVYNVNELQEVAKRGIQASMIGQILIEESILGWDELEVEVVRDREGHKISVCFIENIDPVGVHTGDSFCSAPMLTVPKALQDRLEKYAHDIVEAIGVIGGTNVQFAHDPLTDRVVIIEINPRTSRSSALASKATGFPIAYVSSLLAAGLTLPEIPYWRDGTLDKYTPSGEYVVIKFARWAFEKFKGAQDKLGTQMRAVGEVMSIGCSYKEAFQKAIRSLEIGRYGLGFAKNFHTLTKDQLMGLLSEATSERQFVMYEAIRKGAEIEELYQATGINRWFIQQMQQLVELEEKILEYKGQKLPAELMKQAKQDGFADKYMAMLLQVPETEIWQQRSEMGIDEEWEAVPVSGVEDSRHYYYSTYQARGTSPVSDKQKVMVLGGGPNRIGQGIEFDYCCVHAVFTLRKLGFETIMVNCNPETVSTDYDTADKLYFEPLTAEEVMSIYNKEKPLGMIVQFGGQTPLNLAGELEKRGAKILGTPPSVIDMAEDRDQFNSMMERLNIPMPESGMASSVEEAMSIAGKIGYPLMVRPSFVLGGRGMEVVHDDEMLKTYMNAAIDVTPERPILMDRFLENAVECETDAISDGTNVFIPTVMQHIEQAGVHSGDSACVIPSVSISEENLEVIRRYTESIARELGVVGLMNMQYAICDDKVYVLEANPRASRTVPLVSKVCNINMAELATRFMTFELTGEQPSIDEMEQQTPPYYGVKESVFPFNMFPEVDPLLGPEMRSTGEVLGMSDSFGLAFFKAEEATKSPLPLEGTVFVSVNRQDREGALEVAGKLEALGFKVAATEGTCKYFRENGVNAQMIKKLQEGRPNVVDAMVNGEIQLVVNTPIGKKGQFDDSYLRKTAISNKIPYMTTIPAAIATAKGIEAVKNHEGGTLKSLQEYHASLKK